MGKRIGRRKREEDTTTVNLGFEKMYSVSINDDIGYRIAKLHKIGARNQQQDAFGISDLDRETVDKKGLFAVVADGMGGLASGEKASMATIISCLNYFDVNIMQENIPAELCNMMQCANQQVREVLGTTAGQSGSTVVAVLIRDNKLFFVSVGDSRVVLFRDGKLFQLNKEHNYAADLKRMIEEGLITQDQADTDSQRKALTSYIGQDDVKLIDFNLEAFPLKCDDRILLMTDGIFNTLSYNEILSSMDFSVEKAAMHIEMQIETKRLKFQDNYTALLIES